MAIEEQEAARRQRLVDLERARVDKLEARYKKEIRALRHEINAEQFRLTCERLAREHAARKNNLSLPIDK